MHPYDAVFDVAVPRVTPARVNGGGGGRSELVITWEVNLNLQYVQNMSFWLSVNKC